MMRIILFFCFFNSFLFAEVKVGVDVFLEEGYDEIYLKGKKVGVITNHTAINKELKTTLELLQDKPKMYQIVAIFAPEHGFYGDAYACEKVMDCKLGSISVYSLHGEHRRPTSEMLKDVDVLIYDIQDIGTRSYTFASTLFYCMEEAAKRKIKVIVLDRPNPLGGEIVDGPLLEEKWRSFLGYINVPYCHGMTIGELATFFKHEYHIDCQLHVIPMRGWRRDMSFKETGLTWVPTSPQIPEEDTPFYYPATGLLGHCSLASIGIGYTLPFKLVGAPWIDGEVFAEKLNAQKLPGVHFQPFYFRPFFGKFKQENCQGVKIVIIDKRHYLPVTTQYVMMGVLKNLYPEAYTKAMAELKNSKSKKETFNKLNGTDEILTLMTDKKYFIWELRERFQEDRKAFLKLRKKYLQPTYE